MARGGLNAVFVIPNRSFYFRRGGLGGLIECPIGVHLEGPVHNSPCVVTVRDGDDAGSRESSKKSNTPPLAKFLSGRSLLSFADLRMTCPASTGSTIFSPRGPLAQQKLVNIYCAA